MSEDVAKLPKWAQRRFEDLQRELAHARAELEETRSAHPQTNVRVSGYVTDPDTTLPAGSLIQFRLGNSPWSADVIDVRHNLRDNQRLIVRGNCTRPMAVYPSSSNTIEIGLDEL